MWHAVSAVALAAAPAGRMSTHTPSGAPYFLTLPLALMTTSALPAVIWSAAGCVALTPVQAAAGPCPVVGAGVAHAAVGDAAATLVPRLACSWLRLSDGLSRTGKDPAGWRYAEGERSVPVVSPTFSQATCWLIGHDAGRGWWHASAGRRLSYAPAAWLPAPARHVAAAAPP
jgi:hypothetical protein